ncbi:hypothetical protein GCM10027193_23580 [Arenimonas aestuarii]
MSLVPVICAVVIGAGAGLFVVVREVRAGGSPRDMFYWAAFLTGIIGAFVVWLLGLASMLGDSAQYFLPTLETPAQRRLLLFYAALSGTISASVAAGIVVLASWVKRA